MTNRSREAVGLCKDNYPAPCGQDLARVHDECRVTPTENDNFRGRIEDRNRRQLRSWERNGRRGSRPDGFQVRNMTWKDQHCQNALFNLNRDVLEDAMGSIDSMAGDFEDYLQDLIDDLPAEVAQEIAESIPERVGRKAGCALFGPLAWACAAVSTAYDLYEMGQQAMDTIETIRGLEGELDRLRDLVEDANDIREGLTDPARMEEFKDRKLEEMMDAAENDDCLKARRCFLTPYQNQGQQGRYNRPGAQITNPGGDERMMDRFGRPPHQLDDPRGCCPGMTGHHLVYDSWTRGGPCSSYNKNSAPVVCVVGANQHQGQHGQIHQRADALLEQKMATNNCDFQIDDAVDIAAQSLEDTIGGQCDEECIEQQLEQYYNQAGCGSNQLNPVQSDGTNLSDMCGSMTS